MDAKYLAEIKARCEADLPDVAAPVFRDRKALLAEVERQNKEYDEQDNAHHKLFMAYCEQQKQIATLKKALELMATYLVHFGRIDEMLCDDIPQPLHLKYQPKNDGDYENGPCIQCVQEYFQQQAQQTHETQEEAEK